MSEKKKKTTYNGLTFRKKGECVRLYEGME